MPQYWICDVKKQKAQRTKSASSILNVLLGNGNKIQKILEKCMQQVPSQLTGGKPGQSSLDAVSSHLK